MGLFFFFLKNFGIIMGLLSSLSGTSLPKSYLSTPPPPGLGPLNKQIAGFQTEHGISINFIHLIDQGAPLFRGGYHPRKRTFKTHPKHLFSKCENTP